MLKPDLRKFDRFLSNPDQGDEVMLLSELDGIVACPDLVVPGEWLEVIWGERERPFSSQTRRSPTAALRTVPEVLLAKSEAAAPLSLPIRGIAPAPRRRRALPSICFRLMQRPVD
jgi:hypothetical protein